MFGGKELKDLPYLPLMGLPYRLTMVFLGSQFLEKVLVSAPCVLSFFSLL
jgi:hypothetical protein